MANWTPASKGNTFKPDDVVVYRNTPTHTKLVVDHVESTRVFVRVEGRRRLVDVSSNDLMLLSEWKRIYNP